MSALWAYRAKWMETQWELGIHTTHAETHDLLQIAGGEQRASEAAAEFMNKNKQHQAGTRTLVLMLQDSIHRLK